MSPSSAYSGRVTTLRIAFIGPEGSGKESAMELLRGLVPAPLRGELVSLPSDQDTLLGLDLQAPGLGGGDTPVTLRLQTVRGEATSDGTLDRLFARADGLLFFTGSEPAHTELILDEATEALDRNGRTPDELPALFVRDRRLNPALVREMAALLGTDPRQLKPIDFETGSGLFEAIGRLTDFVLHGGDPAAPGIGAEVEAEPQAGSEDITSDPGEPLFSPYGMPDDDAPRGGGSTFQFSGREDSGDRKGGLFGLFGKKKR